jgi:hydrogenase nickel incorporation protein HypA/HybF
MHELTICEALLERIDRERATTRFNRVVRVRLELGRFSCLDPEALRHAFDLLGRGTILENATLDIDRPPTRAVCRECGAETTVDGDQDSCPACKTGRLKAMDGSQMRFIEMEVA